MSGFLKRVLLGFMSLCIMSQSSFASYSSSGFTTKLKALLGLAQLTQGNQSLAASSSHCVPMPVSFAHARCLSPEYYAQITRMAEAKADHESLSLAIADLSTLKVIETKDEKEAREKAESQVSQALKSVHKRALDLPDSQSKTGNEKLKEKGYQYTQGALINRYHVYKKRYPINFGAFLYAINEKQLTGQVIGNFMRSLNDLFPSYATHGLKIFDIGCGNGEFSSSLVARLKNVFNIFGAAQSKRISFSGIDPQESFVKSTNDLVGEFGVNTDVVVGDFRDNTLKPQQVAAFNFIIASHSAYVFTDMAQFIAKIESMLAKNGIAILLHNGDTPINILRKEFSDTLKQSVTGNVLDRIESALNASGLSYGVLDFEPVVTFPPLNRKEWRALRFVKSSEYDADYSDWSPKLLEAKRMLEFFLQDPLEAFTQSERDALIVKFKDLLVKHNYEIPLLNRMHIIASRDCDKELLQAIKASI
jgi:SAM-dependent methyltransferase